MIDMIGTIAGTAIYAVLIGVLVGLSSLRAVTKLAAFAAAAVWGGIIVTIAVLGGFAPGATGPIPAPVFAFAACLALLFGGWFLLPRFRSALLSVPLPALIGLNAARLGGVFNWRRHCWPQFFKKSLWRYALANLEANRAVALERRSCNNGRNSHNLSSRGRPRLAPAALRPNSEAARR